MEFLIGLDLGQASDPSALCVLKQSVVSVDSVPTRDRNGYDSHKYDVVHMHRWPLGTPYPVIVAEVAGLLGRPELQAPQRGRPSQPRLVVDATGVGRPIVDLFAEAGLPAELVPVTITGGDQARRDIFAPGLWGWWAPKRELVAQVQRLLQTGRLLIVPTLGQAETLKRELLHFQVRVSLAAHETFGAWREGQHDDLVLAVALACWLGEKPVGRFELISF